MEMWRRVRRGWEAKRERKLDRKRGHEMQGKDKAFGKKGHRREQNGFIHLYCEEERIGVGGRKLWGRLEEWRRGKGRGVR
jgi:hypothetical protein